MKPADYLTTAAGLVSGDRARQHGDKRENHENIAAMWSAWLTRRLGVPVTLRGSDVAAMMVALKLAGR